MVVAMSNDARLSKRVAILTGLVMVIGGAEIPEVEAATLTQSIPMPDLMTAGTSMQSNSATVDFNQFNTALGTLTDVQLTLNSLISVEISAQGFNPDIAATVKIDDVQIGPTGAALAVLGGGAFSFGPTEAALSPPELSFYEGSSIFDVSLLLNVNSSDSVEAFVDWGFFENEDALTLTYTYTPGISGTPLPAALPLFATGVAGLGFTTWRRRRRGKVARGSNRYSA
jgi:hypothetical protein